MLGGRTCSAAARAPSDRGPPNTSTDNAESCAGPEPGGDVHLPDEPEQMNGGRVQAEGDLGREVVLASGRRRRRVALDIRRHIIVSLC